jgi:predicted  nucleic acid-binding Zn-ribbon protein
MSEYQYYEFQTIDRRLTPAEMAKLRDVSTRARITPTSFVNEYEWGDFRGDVDAWMEQYFDAFLYFANWGSRVFKLRLSSKLLSIGAADMYCVGESASARERKGNTILAFEGDAEDDTEWKDESDALAALIPIRAQLARGDLRALYIGWLLCVHRDEVDEDAQEPPVPAGLGELDGSLARLVDFLRVDPDLVNVAAAASAPLVVQALSRHEIRKWIAAQQSGDKHDYLERFIAGEEPELASELQRRIVDRSSAAAVSRSQPRTAGALLHAAADAAEERRRAEAARANAERKRREQEAALARATYLEKLARKQPAVWTEIEQLIATKQPGSYDRAVSLLVDLRDIAAARGEESTFLRHIHTLEMKHARKPSLLAKMQRAGIRR